MNNLKIHDAIIFAADKHRNQMRKGTDIPYITHPMEVMQILTDNQCGEDVIIAGILHDTLEDTDTTPHDIETKFGKKVLAIVQGETEDKSKTWKERKQGTIDRLKSGDLETQLVGCADKLSNIRSIYSDRLEVGDKVFDRFGAPKNDIQWYYQSVVGALDKINGYKMKLELAGLVKTAFGKEFTPICLEAENVNVILRDKGSAEADM
ncbi:MAG: HD domain-containing protein [Alphaproteobacteria bacterium]|nr:HD domain-containing protein [Alphaproteobacteria bacterium]